MYRSIFYIILRAVGAYLLLMVITRSIGRKTISQVTFFDFSVAITLGTLTASAGMGTDISSYSAMTVMITFAALPIITGYLHIKGIGCSSLHWTHQEIYMLQKG